MCPRRWSAAGTGGAGPAPARPPPARPGPATRTSRWQGNGGYDVEVPTALDLAYTPATRRLDGTAAIAATATKDLSRFDLDLRGIHGVGR